MVTRTNPKYLCFNDNTKQRRQGCWSSPAYPRSTSSAAHPSPGGDLSVHDVAPPLALLLLRRIM